MYSKKSVNNITSLILVAIIFLTISCKKTETKPVIGETFKGGKVFFIDNTGEHGLVVAATDQGTGSEWGCIGTTISGADGTAVGTGNQNTIDITKGCTEAGTAAKVCSDLVLEGFSDWYLPSKEELSLLFAKKDVIGGFKLDTYWSSSEVNGNSAWLQSFETGVIFSTTPKDYGTNVRAIRAF